MADEEEQTRIVALPPNSDNTNHYSLQTKDGTVLFTKLEYKVFGKIFDLVDSDADSIICGKEGSFFLRRSGLDNSKLQEVFFSISPFSLTLYLPLTSIFIFVLTIKERGGSSKC